VTLVGRNGGQAVTLHNVAAGKDQTDAVNVGQMESKLESVGGKVVKDANGNAQLTGFVAYDDVGHTKVTLGGTDASGRAQTVPVAVTNLRSGAVFAGSTDAVNGAQLYSMMRMLGPSASYDPQIGAFKWNYKFQNGAVVNSLDAAVSILDQRLATVEKPGSTASLNSTDGKSAQGDANGNVITTTGHVGAGDVSAVSTDPVNGAQLWNTNRQVESLNRRVDDLQNSVSEVQRNAYSGIASATALAMIPDIHSDKNFAVGIGTANYKGYQAMAFGASARVSNNLSLRFGAGFSGGNTSLGAGASYQW
jgi:trimeric autotransporter adhesin